jgi:hypothetical protein
MKLRIRGNTLRLRLSQSEVDQIGRGQSVVETTTFPDGGQLQYLIRTSEFQTNVVKSGGVLNTLIEVIVEKTVAERWVGSEEVGLYGATPLLVGSLELLVEKDFACINPRDGVEDKDSFPNPSSITVS